MESRQGRDGDLIPIGSLSRRARRRQDSAGDHESNDREEVPFHCAPPWLASDDAGVAVSIMPTVRLLSVKVLLATRRMSALVILSMRSTSRNSSRQSQ